VPRPVAIPRGSWQIRSVRKGGCNRADTQRQVVPGRTRKTLRLLDGSGNSDRTVRFGPGYDTSRPSPAVVPPIQRSSAGQAGGWSPGTTGPEFPTADRCEGGVKRAALAHFQAASHREVSRIRIGPVFGSWGQMVQFSRFLGGINQQSIGGKQKTTAILAASPYPAETCESFPPKV
jgi:hypothetical protein